MLQVGESLIVGRADSRDSYSGGVLIGGFESDRVGFRLLEFCQREDERFVFEVELSWKLDFSETIPKLHKEIGRTALYSIASNPAGDLSTFARDRRRCRVLVRDLFGNVNFKFVMSGQTTDPAPSSTTVPTFVPAS